MDSIKTDLWRRGGKIILRFTMPSFDEVLKEAGEFGKFQKTVFLLLCQTGITFSWLFVGIVFLGRAPEHYWCRIPGAAHCEWSPEEEANFTLLLASNLGNASSSSGQCERYDIAAWNSSGSSTSLSCANPLYHLTNNNSLGSVPLTACQDGWLYKQPHSTIASEVREFKLLQSIFLLALQVSKTHRRRRKLVDGCRLLSTFSYPLSPVIPEQDH